MVICVQNYSPLAERSLALAVGSGLLVPHPADTLAGAVGSLVLLGSVRRSSAAPAHAGSPVAVAERKALPGSLSAR